MRKRLIPAYAGRTTIQFSVITAYGAHPRLRGADPQWSQVQIGQWGSSPLTRGGLGAVALPDYWIGLIPAYAGRTISGRASVDRQRAHPRLRGADLDCDFFECVECGSSPLTRGGPTTRVSAPDAEGLIPAYAGRTLPRAGHSCISRAHPRLRGADLSPCRACYPSWGSSPLTRGGLASIRDRGRKMGLIPAYAGRTLHRPTPWNEHRAHPRLRGADTY